MREQWTERLVLLSGVGIIGSLVGTLLMLFAAPLWVWGLVLLMIGYLALVGTGGIFLINIGLTGLFFRAAILRPWTDIWFDPMHPMQQASTWARMMLLFWVGAIALSVILGLTARHLMFNQVKRRDRLVQLLLAWISGAWISRALALNGLLLALLRS